MLYSVISCVLDYVVFFFKCMIYLITRCTYYLRTGGKHTLQINFENVTKVSGFRVWNYNKNSEDSLRGVKTVKISADNRFLGYSVFCIAPGCDGVEFGQTVYMGDVLRPSRSRMPGLASETTDSNNENNNNNNNNNGNTLRYISPAIKQDFESPVNPSGLLWKFIFYENWFDGYYIGLDAIEMFDIDGNILNLKQCGADVTATPHSLIDLVPSGNRLKSTFDPRTPEKLFLPFRDKDGFKKKEKSSSWLAPFSKSMSNDEKISNSNRIKRKQIDIINEKSKMNGNGRGQNNIDNISYEPSLFEELVIPVNNVLFVMFPYPVAVSFIR